MEKSLLGNATADDNCPLIGDCLGRSLYTKQSNDSSMHCIRYGV